MNKTDRLYRDKQQGLQAQHLLNDTALIAALDAMRSDAIAEWEEANEIAARERLHMRVQVISEFRHRLEMMVADGKRAQTAITKE